MDADVLSDTTDEASTTVRPTLAPIQRLLLVPNEAAEVLRISPRLLWNKTKLGEIKSVKIGKLVRYDVRDLQAFIERLRGEG